MQGSLFILLKSNFSNLNLQWTLWIKRLWSYWCLQLLALGSLTQCSFSVWWLWLMNLLQSLLNKLYSCLFLILFLDFWLVLRVSWLSLTDIICRQEFLEIHGILAVLKAILFIKSPWILIQFYLNMIVRTFECLKFYSCPGLRAFWIDAVIYLVREKESWVYLSC